MFYVQISIWVVGFLRFLWGFVVVFVLFVLLDVGKIGLFGGICIKILIEQEK